MDKITLSSFLTEDEILAEVEEADSEMARHLLSLRQPTDATLDRRVATIAEPEPRNGHESTTNNRDTLGQAGWWNSFGALSGQALRLAATLLLAVGVWGLFRVMLSPAAQTATEAPPAVVAPAASPEALARALVLYHGGEEALSGFRLLAEQPLGAGRVLLFTFQSLDSRPFVMPLVLMYAEQGPEGWVWRDGHDLNVAVSDLTTSINLFTATVSDGWVPIGGGYAFYGAARPGVARLEIVEQDGEQWTVAFDGDQPASGFLRVQEGAGGAPPRPVAVRAYDENNNELVGLMEPTATAEMGIASTIVPFSTPTLVPLGTATPFPTATGSPLIGSPVPSNGGTATPLATWTPWVPGVPTIGVTEIPWTWTPTPPPWNGPTMTQVPGTPGTPWVPPTPPPPATLTPWDGQNGPPPTAVPWLTPTPWDGENGPPTPPPTTTPWDGPGGPPTPPPDWPAPWTATPVPPPPDGLTATPTPFVPPTPWDGENGPPTPPPPATSTPWDGQNGPPTPPAEWRTATPVPPPPDGSSPTPVPWNGEPYPPTPPAEGPPATPTAVPPPWEGPGNNLPTPFPTATPIP